jgi:hypothetical protein
MSMTYGRSKGLGGDFFAIVIAMCFLAVPALAAVMEALPDAQALEKQLLADQQRNTVLVSWAVAVRKRADQAVLDAEQAEERAAQALWEFEDKTKIILKETQAKARALEAGADEAQISLRDSLRLLTPATQGRDQMQLSALIMLVIICIAFVVMALVFYRIGRRAGLQVPNATTVGVDGVAAVEPQRVDSDIDSVIAEYLLDGTDDKGIRYKLRVPDRQLRTEAGIVIGRNPQGSPYIINYADVSRRHARMRMMQDRIFIEDLGSTNGTRVNGQSIDNKGPTSVMVGDLITIGSVVLTLQVAGA